MSKEMFQRSQDVRDIEFCINGVRHVVSDKFPPSTTLNDYIRDVAGLKGTKIMCKEAGCGCCAVTVTHANNGTKVETMSINSCLCPLYSVDGWQISTVEGIGNHRDGFHPIQERLAKLNGTQCGYCSPGFVMSMYGLLHQQPSATQQEIEDSFDGHICRCTGYRSILDAMKLFGSDSTSKDGSLDIEDLNKNLCPKTGETCRAKCDTNADKGTLPRTLAIDLYGTKWYRPVNLNELSKFMSQHKTNSIKLLYGNTASGIFKNQGPFDVYIDLRAVSELHIYQEKDSAVVFGAGTTLTSFKEYLKGLYKKPGFHYCDRVVKHLKVLASVLVRNAGCIAGNLMIKHGHNEFPSDLFTMMEAIGSKIEYLDTNTSKRMSNVSLMDFLKLDMKGKVLVSLELPAWKSTDHYRSFKITPRSQNAHAYINAAFKIPTQDRKIISRPNIVIGGLTAQIIHVEKTESYLDGKVLSDAVIHEALTVMHSEINPSNNSVYSSPKYRKDLATNLLYKTLLEVYKPSSSAYQSGAESISRPLSSGMFTFQEKPSEFPLKEALPKKTAILQTAGEAQYINDIPTFQHELVAAFVSSTIGSGTIKSVDTSEAMKIPGVIRYIGVEDLPKGFINNYFGPASLFPVGPEELFVSKEVFYEGQSIGVILAETAALAEEGVKKVKINYESVTPAVMNIEDAIQRKSIFEDATKEAARGDPEAAFKNCAHVVQGEVSLGTQYQFFLENMVALTVPSEDGIDVYAGTQWPDHTQTCVSHVIGKPRNYCNVIVPRIGGAFGGKLFRATGLAAAAAVCTELTGRPIRINLDLSTCMKMTEKRFPILAKYQAGCDSNGKMQAVDINIYIDSGLAVAPAAGELLFSTDQAYYVPNIKVKNYYMKTNKSLSGACRGPGAVPGVLVIEAIIEHMAKEIGQHPIIFKELNLYQKGQTDLMGIELTYCSLHDIWRRLKQMAEVDARKEDVDRFNKNNMWRKRGITMTAVKYNMNYMPGGFPTSVSIFAGDGTVTVCTAGVEMGQGLFMKVAQAVAKTLGVPLDSVKVRPCNNNFTPNGCLTAGSTASERCVRSAIKACEKINEGLAPLKEKMSEAPFPQILTAAVFSNIPLYATVDADTPGPICRYCTYLVGVNETEVDVLTGEFQVKRVDILADFGESLNPTVDLGQVQGAYIMGLGAYMTEDIYYDPNSGKLLNDGTWEYKPPTTKDIPIDWRIHFLPDHPYTDGVMGSKATGEPPVGLSSGALFAIKSCVEKVREQLTGEKKFSNTSAPFTVEKIQQAANIQVNHLRVLES